MKSYSDEMTDQKSEDWLPTGWTVEVKVRNNGKRDKYYYDTASGHKFNSKAEVSRYLNTSQISDEVKQKVEETLKRSANDVVVEKTIAEGLPQGWIKEIRMTKKDHKIRRDSYYIDPVSEKLFRSMKDVNRYLENEEPRRLILEPSHGSDKELEDEKASSSHLNEIMKDGQILNLACKGESPTFPAQTSDQTEVDTESGSLNPTEAKGSEQKEQDGDSYKSEFISVPAGFGLADKQCLESGLFKHESKKTQLSLGKSKKKKELNLPRRASKRLAGVEVDPVPELKTSTRARRVTIKQSREGVHSTTEGSSSGNSTGSVFRQPGYPEVEPEKHVQNVETVISGDEKQTCASVFPEEHAGKLETTDKAEEKPGLQPDLPLGDFLTDPCIAFAIETLTGIAFENSRSNSEQSSGDLATPKDRSGNKEEDNKRSNVVLAHGNLFIPEQHGGKVGKDDKAEQKSGSPVELPFGGLWPDPCIEFAIKTLTGAIPLDYDPHIEEYFQQQLSSSRTQGNSDLTLKNVGLDNFCQTDVLCQQFSEPAHTRNASLHSSGGSDTNQ